MLGLTDGFHVLELVKNVPLFPDDPEGKMCWPQSWGSQRLNGRTLQRPARHSAPVEDLGLRYQIEGKILAPIPSTRSSAAKKLVGEIPLAQRPRQSGLCSPVGVPGREGLAGPHGAQRAPYRLSPWCSRYGRTASRTKATTAPGAGALGVPPPGPAHLWSGWSKI